MMTPVSHPGPAARAHRRAWARRTGTGARRAALFASGLQRPDAPTAAMAAEAVTATVRRLGVHGCVSQMAQEFGDHPDAAADRMRWICQLAAEVPGWPRVAEAAGSACSKAGNGTKPSCDYNGATAGLGGPAGAPPRSTTAGEAA
jgi:hypothetical protein